MSLSQPSQEPPSGQSSTELSSSTVDAPTLTPDQAGGGISSSGDNGGNSGVAAWLNDKRVTGLWAINQNRNSWVYITGVGWRRLADNSDSAVMALSIVSANAKLSAATYNYREEADGKIHEAYAW